MTPKTKVGPIVLNVDIAPSLLQLAKVDQPSEPRMDGHFLPLDGDQS